MKPYPVSPDEVVIKLKKLIKLVESLQQEQSEVTPAQARILFPIISQKRSFSMAELAKLGGVDKALVSRTVADLESKGFVKRERYCLLNRSRCKIALTVKGDDFFAQKIKEISIKHFNGVSADELAGFLNILDKLVKDEE